MPDAMDPDSFQYPSIFPQGPSDLAAAQNAALFKAAAAPPPPKKTQTSMETFVFRLFLQGLPFPSGSRPMHSSGGSRGGRRSSEPWAPRCNC